MSLRALATYARRARAPAPGERCELCSAPVPESHAHVVDLQQRSVMCACRPCAILFERPGSGGDRYRTVPTRVRVDPALELTVETWQQVGVPVNLAFVFFNSSLGRWTALYPSPAGTTEAEVDEEGWAALAARTPLVGCIEPDVEALMIHGRRGDARLECFLVPIDSCYELAASVRRRWRGFDGGDEVRREVEGFFATLRKRSRPIEEVTP